MSFAPDASGDAERRRLVALFGHFVTVTIDAVGPRQTGAVVTEPIELEALVDTGASDVCIDVLTAQSIGLKSVNETMIEGVGGRLAAHIYMARLSVLLGRSFLQNYSATFDGPSGFLHLAKPATFQPSGAIEDDFAT